MCVFKVRRIVAVVVVSKEQCHYFLVHQNLLELSFVLVAVKVFVVVVVVVAML